MRQGKVGIPDPLRVEGGWEALIWREVLAQVRETLERLTEVSEMCRTLPV